MTPLHVVQLLPELNEGGVERGVVELNRELVRHGIRSTIICARGRLADEIVADGGEIRFLDICSKNPLTLPWRVRQLRKLANELNPDILHVRSRVPGWLVHFANRSPRRHLVTTVHGYNSVSPYSRIMTSGERVICVSYGIESFIRENYGTPQERIRVIYRGVDLEAFSPAAVDKNFITEFRRRHGLEGMRIVAAVGRISELKGYDILLKAAAKFLPGRPDVRILIVGGCREDKAAYLEGLRGLARQLGIADQVIFAGSERRIAEIYQLSDVLVSASRKPESFGRTLVEAMAMGTPVVAANHGGATEIIATPDRGRLFPPGDADALADCLASLLDAGKADARQLRAVVENEFSLQKMVDGVIAVYRELVP